MSLIILANINARDTATSTVVTLRFGEIGYNHPSAPGFFEDHILRLPSFRREISFGASLGGATSDRFDSLRIDNSNGDLDYLRDWGLAGQRVEFLIGDSSAAYSSFVSLFVGRIDQALFDMTTLELAFRDRREDLDQPIQINKYNGSNVLPDGLEGVDDIKGKVKPLVFGEVLNVSPPAVNTSRLIYQVNDGAVADVTAVYDKGVALTKGADYASRADMEANAPAAGNYRVWKAGGYFRLGTTPQGSITADVLEGSSAALRSAAQVAQRIVTRTGGIPAGDVNPDDVAALDAKNAAAVGISIDGESTFQAALDAILPSVGAWYGFDRLGKFRMARLDLPDSSAATFKTGTLDLDDLDIVDVRFLPTKQPDRGKPVWRIIVNYARNWTLQQGDAVAGSVTTERRNFLSLATRSTDPADDLTTKDRNPLASQRTIDTLLVSLTAAEDERDRELAILFGRQDLIEIDIKLSQQAISLLDLGYGATLELARFGYDDGRKLVVSGLEYNPITHILTVALWGWMQSSTEDLIDGVDTDLGWVAHEIVGRIYLGSLASPGITDTIDLGPLP